MKKIKVLFISFYYPPDFCAGSFRAESVYNALKDDNRISKFYVYTTFPHRYGKISNIKNKKQYFESDILRVKIPQHNGSFSFKIFSFFIFALRIIFTSFKNKNSFDIIFITSSRFGTAMLGYFLSIFLNKPLAVDIRDIFSDSLKSLGSEKSIIINFFSKVIKKIELIILEHAKWKNFVSPGFLEYYPDINIKKENINLFTNGIDKIFIENRLRLVNGAKTFSKSMRIVYAGNIGYGQGLEKIIIPLAISMNKEINFTIIGDGSSKHEIVNKIKKFNLTNIEILKPLNRDELISYYNSADCLFLHLNDIPAFKRVIPSKIFEYATFEKPVLAGVSGTSEKFIKENLDGFYLFNPNDVNKAKLLMKEIINNYKVIKIDNSKFIQNFERSVITKRMINNLISNI